MFHGSLESSPESALSGGVATLPVGGPTVASTRGDLESQIVGCLQRRVREVEVEVHAERTVVRGVTQTWHDRQLAEKAILKQVAGPIEFAIRVGG